MTIAQAFNDIAVAQGGTAKNGTISGAIDALNDALAGSDQQQASTIEGAVRLLGEHIGGGGGGTHRLYYFGEDPNSVYYEPGNVPITLEDTTHGGYECKTAEAPTGYTVVFVLSSVPESIEGGWEGGYANIGVSVHDTGGDTCQMFATVPASDFYITVE